MTYQQRDLVYVTAELPTGETEKHPFLIISCRAASSKETYYTGVMMTGSPQTDLFTFKVDDNMFESPLQKRNCQIRLYIIVSFHKSKIEEFITRMKKIHFKAVMDNIKEFVLSVD